MPPLNLALLRQRLNTTALWYRSACPKPTDPARDTRSALAPAGHLLMLTTDDAGTEDLYRPTPFERLAIVDDLAFQREKALEATGMIAPTKTLMLAGGRILECLLDRSDHDGLSQYHSRGLIDAFDIPGHDTWLMLTRTEASDTLLAWIPPPFLHDADAAIWASPSQCLRWINEKSLMS